MRLNDMLARSRAFEESAAALYRRWAAAARNDPTLCALWTALARDEDSHARALADADMDMPAVRGWRTRIDGWQEGLNAIAERLRAAEQIPFGADVAQQLIAALELELTEMDALRLLLLDVAGKQETAESPDAHACRLADAAVTLTIDPAVGLKAALVHARARMRGAPATPGVG
jgi:bacterioferritin (cytochrome b1)